MAMDYHKLPKDKKQLADIINSHVQRQKQEYAPSYALWQVYIRYLNHVRLFERLDFETGKVTWAFQDESNKLQYRHTKLLSVVELFRGILMDLDWSPYVKRDSLSLQSVRERAAAQAILDTVVQPHLLKEALNNALYNMLVYGATGIYGGISEHETLGLSADIMAIHPCELFTFPCVGFDLAKQRGIVWERCLPMQVLKDRFGPQKIAANKDKLSWRKVQYGEQLEASASDWAMHGNAGSGTSSSGEEQEIVDVREVWLDGPHGTCSRYIVQSGDCILEDRDLSDKEYFCPVSWARFGENGSPHGFGLCHLLFGPNREAELSLAQLYENMRKSDRWPVLMLPHGTFDEKVDFRDTGFGMRVGHYSPNPFGASGGAVVVQPANSGTLPGKIAEIALGTMNDIVPISAVLFGDAPGRTDSTSALMFLEQKAFTPFKGCFQALKGALGGVYRSLLAQANMSILDGGKPLPISNLDTSLAGLVLADGATATFGPAQNPLPKPGLLEFSIKDESPRSALSQKMECLDLVERQVQTPQQALMFLFEQGLEPAVYAPTMREGLRKIKRDIVILFGDGVTPGQITRTPYSDAAPIALMELDGFMASPEFSMASSTVQNAFANLKMYLMEQVAPSMPDSVPAPEQIAAEMEMAMIQQQMEQELMGGGGEMPENSQGAPTGGPPQGV